jgi:hypothetical protein
MYVNYFSISANTIIREAERSEMNLKNSAVDRFAKNTDLRYDERTNRTCVRQLRDALGSKKLKQKAVRQDAKWLIKCLTAIFPDKVQLLASGKADMPPHVTQEGQDEAVIEAIEEERANDLPALPELSAPVMEALDETAPQVQLA